MSLSFALRVAALVVFILAALFFFGVGSISQATALGLTAVGLASWCGSTLVP